ncbi:MAG TPA: FAD-dependent oxidoreductase, partial [Dehalococcoidales bacterium]|nr:FAD-dependent oxidoreductase [Dehalococcoidales bacterium]
MPDKVGAVLVIGAGAGGIRSALDLAESGYKVYLTDRAPSIGGALLQLETWFPDNGCEFCKLLPVFNRDDCSQFCLRRDLMHPNIEVIPGSRLTKLEGVAGDFKATLNIQSRWIHADYCTACGLCAQVCPVEVNDEFDRSLKPRKAAFVRNPQAIPNVYAIDREHCTHCEECVKICPTKAISLDMPDETRVLNTSAVIVAAGSTELPAGEMGQYGYGKYANVLTNIQLERMLANAGPTGGNLRRPSDSREPKRIAILQCVGSRDAERGYCSEVCCMYALKEAMLLRDNYPDAKVTIFYMDIRAFGKDYYRYHLQAKEKGVNFVRSRVSRIRENPKNKNLFLLARDESGKLISPEYDLAVLSVAQCPSRDLGELIKILDVKPNQFGFVDVPGLYLSRTSKPGIFVGGAASGPSDIAETVITSGAAALEVSTILTQTGKQIVEKKAVHSHEVAESPKFAVYICKCGTEVSSIVDMEKTKAYAAKLPNVVDVQEVGFLCLPDTLGRLKEVLAKSGANRVVMAACTPFRYQRLFGDVLNDAGIDPSMWQLVNIREQVAWVHKDKAVKDLATRKAQSLLAMAVEKLNVQEPLKVSALPMVQNCLVIGGGISGCIAASSIAGLGYDVTIVEKTGELGGQSRAMHFGLSGDVSKETNNILDSVRNNPGIKVMLNSEVEAVSGNVGQFLSSIKNSEGKIDRAKFGAVIVATGAKNYIPHEYLYGKDPRVITQRELHRMIAEGKLNKPSAIVMIQCVGSRNDEHSYCNRTCCSEAIANAQKIKEISPETRIHIINRDIMAYGMKELDYLKVRQSGVLFQRYELGKEPQVTAHANS